MAASRGLIYTIASLYLVGILLLYVGIAYSSLVAGLIGIGFFYVASIIYLISHEGFFHVDVVSSVFTSIVKSLWYIFKDGGFKGRGVYIPTEKYVKIFVGRDEVLVEIPNVSEETLIVSSPPGIMVTPACAGLVDMLSKMFNFTAGMDIHESMAILSRVFEELDLAESFDYFIEDNRLNVRLTKVLGGGFCDKVAIEFPGACEKFGCPVCSLVAAVACLSYKSPVLIESVYISQNGSNVDLTVRVLR